MLEFKEIVKNRRSIRKFTNKDVTKKHIDELIDAVKWSPSWANCQCWEIIVIRNNATKKSIQATLPLKGNPARKAITEAPVLLGMCAKTKISGYYNQKAATKFGDWFMYDLGIATQSLCLNAHYLGLGTVIVGLYNHDNAKKILKIPEGYELMTIIPVGYPARVGSIPKRRKKHEITHVEFFETDKKIS